MAISTSSPHDFHRFGKRVKVGDLIELDGDVIGAYGGVFGGIGAGLKVLTTMRSKDPEISKWIFRVRTSFYGCFILWFAFIGGLLLWA